MVKATPKKTAYKSGLEAEYALWLDSEKRLGNIKDWAYEVERLKLGDGAWYTPDFRVVMPDNTVEMRETKGFWREAAKVRIKAAAFQHPYRFVAIQKATKKDGGGWKIEEF